MPDTCARNGILRLGRCARRRPIRQILKSLDHFLDGKFAMADYWDLLGRHAEKRSAAGSSAAAHGVA
jgi:hypothetical protein